MREKLAKRLVWILAGTLAIGFGLLATVQLTGLDQNALLTMFDVVFTALVALVSSVVGFYFGAEGASRVTEEQDELEN